MSTKLNGLSMKKMFQAIGITALLTASATAAVVIDVIRDGPHNTRLVGTGSLDLASTLGPGAGAGGTLHSFTAVKVGEEFTLGVSPVGRDAYALANWSWTGAAPDIFVSGNPYVDHVDGNPALGVFVNYLSRFANHGNLYVPAGYLSGDPLDFTGYIHNYDFRDYGFEYGDSIVVRWSNGGVSESLTLNFIIPEPGTTGMLGGCLLGWLALRRRGD